MADIARLEISPSPSKVGRILSSIGKFTVDYTLVDFLTGGINGRKKVKEFVQKKVKGSPLSLCSSNSSKIPGDIEVIVHDVLEVVNKGQEEVVKLHERCAKSLGGPEPCKKKMTREVPPKEVNHSGTHMNRVYIRSRL